MSGKRADTRLKALADLALQPMSSHAPNALNPAPQIPLGRGDRIGPAVHSLAEFAAMPAEQRKRVALRESLNAYNAGSLGDLGEGLMMAGPMAPAVRAARQAGIATPITEWADQLRREGMSRTAAHLEDIMAANPRVAAHLARVRVDGSLLDLAGPDGRTLMAGYARPTADGMHEIVLSPASERLDDQAIRELLTEELTHVAQRIGQPNGVMDAGYRAAEDRFGYELNPYELSAKAAGRRRTTGVSRDEAIREVATDALGIYTSHHPRRANLEAQLDDAYDATVAGNRRKGAR